MQTKSYINIFLKKNVSLDNEIKAKELKNENQI